MRISLSSIVILVMSVGSHGQLLPTIVNEEQFCIGKTLTIKSAELGEERILNVYLPGSYEQDSSKHYPVIYLLDGSVDEDIIHISGIVQFASFPWINSMPEAIVVGIANVDRVRDFTTPSKHPLDQKEFPTSGEAGAFVNFLENELQPLVESTFRITAPSTIIGQSLAGLLATEILHSKPELFDNYIIVSPSLWWNEGALLGRPTNPLAASKSIYIAVGNEGHGMADLARELHKKLADAYPDNDSNYFQLLEDKDHGDALHQAVYHALEMLFRKDDVEEKTVD